MRVFVLLFNVGTEDEGIHSIRLKEERRNVVLMFESEDDATRFGLLLEAQDFQTPLVEGIDSEEVEEFCEGAGYECVLVPEGTLAVPPEANASKTDLEIEREQTDPADAGDTSEDEDAEFSLPDLDVIRKRLEGLL
ncbi:MAG TPA: DUF3110 domain-containing protein [Chroococcidiopsis sp.]